MGGLLQPVVEPARHGVARRRSGACTTSSSWRHRTMRARSSTAGRRARTTAAHVLKNSAAAPCTIALRPYRPRAAARERPSGSGRVEAVPAHPDEPTASGAQVVAALGRRVQRRPGRPWRPGSSSRDRATPRRRDRWSARTSRRARRPWRCRGRRPAGPPPAHTCRCPARPKRARRHPTRRRGSSARSDRGRRGRTRAPARPRSPGAGRRACCAGRRSPSSDRRHRRIPTTARAGGRRRRRWRRARRTRTWSRSARPCAT